MYSINSAGPTSIRCTAEKYANCAPATGKAPNTSTNHAFARNAPQRPRSARAAIGATTSAPIARRARTTAPALQPASSRPRASDPDSPNDAAEATANASPIPACERNVLSLAMDAIANDHR